MKKEVEFEIFLNERETDDIDIGRRIRNKKKQHEISFFKHWARLSFVLPSELLCNLWGDDKLMIEDKNHTQVATSTSSIGRNRRTLRLHQ